MRDAGCCRLPVSRELQRPNYSHTGIVRLLMRMSVQPGQVLGMDEGKDVRNEKAMYCKETRILTHSSLLLTGSRGS